MVQTFTVIVPKQVYSFIITKRKLADYFRTATKFDWERIGVFVPNGQV